MNSIEDITHFLLDCPYLDGARFYSLLMWKTNLSHPIYNLYSSAMLLWSNIKIVSLLLDPMSQFQSKDINSHLNLDNDMLSFAQDYIYSLHRQRQLYYGEDKDE